MDLETILGYLLITGVLIGLVFLVIGVSYYVYQRGVSIDLSESLRYRSIISWVEAIKDMDFRDKILSIGLLAIILTPYIRAVLSLLWFVYHRDKKFILFTLFVVSVLTLSLLGLIRAF